MPPTQPQAHAAIANLIEKYRKLDDAARKTISEAGVVNQFVCPLLTALGWPIGDPARYKYELHTEVGRPDMTLIPEQGGVVFVEAKRFGVIRELAQVRNTLEGVVTPGQMALSGMATGRTKEEQQAINYAFSNGGMWAILTNFERLRLFNARRDWLVLAFERPGAYLDEFDLLWQLSYLRSEIAILRSASASRPSVSVSSKGIPSSINRC
jgi:predicted type IV restriction endonuclease